ESIRLHGLPTMEGRVPTFAFSVEGIPAPEAAARLGERGFAVWHGNYYALEVMKRLGLEDDGGAVRVGFVHYNTGEEVERLLAVGMSLAAGPVYLWGRSLVSRRSALVAAALTVAAPGLTYSGLVMTEVLFYPLLVLAAWAAAEAIARPTLRTQGLLVLAVAAA